MAKNGTPLDWALEKVSPEPMSGCWIWTSTLDKDGYAKFSLSAESSHTGKKNSVRAHRFIYESLRGKIPDDLVTDHKCRVRSCCNPDHIEIVTSAENSRRGVPNIEACRRGGQLSPGGAMQHAKTHCPQGHDYGGWNLMVYKSGSRACRACCYERNRIFKAKGRRQ